VANLHGFLFRYLGFGDGEISEQIRNSKEERS
jgi:hypothetical protein